MRALVAVAVLASAILQAATTTTGAYVSDRISENRESTWDSGSTFSIQYARGFRDPKANDSVAVMEVGLGVCPDAPGADMTNIKSRIANSTASRTLSLATYVVPGPTGQINFAQRLTLADANRYSAEEIPGGQDSSGWDPWADSNHSPSYNLTGTNVIALTIDLRLSVGAGIAVRLGTSATLTFLNGANLSGQSVRFDFPPTWGNTSASYIEADVGPSSCPEPVQFEVLDATGDRDFDGNGVNAGTLDSLAIRVRRCQLAPEIPFNRMRLLIGNYSASAALTLNAPIDSNSSATNDLLATSTNYTGHEVPPNQPSSGWDPPSSHFLRGNNTLRLIVDLRGGGTGADLGFGPGSNASITLFRGADGSSQSVRLLFPPSWGSARLINSSVSTSGCGPTAPGAPRDFRATAGIDQVGLDWTSPTQDGGAPISNFLIHRGIQSGNLSLLKEIGNTTAYLDTGVANGITYYYQVSAKNGAGEGARSLEVNATPGPGADVTSPSAATDLAIVTAATTNVTMSWTAAGDDATVGTAAKYDLRYSKSGPISDDLKFTSATRVLGLPSPAAAGTQEFFTVGNLAPATDYWFALKTADEVPNWSPLSNSPLGRTTGQPDASPPTVAITEPLENQTVSGSSVVRCSAVDNMEVVKVVLLVDGSVHQEVPGAPWEFIWDTRSFQDGTHVLSARAYDAAGNEGLSRRVPTIVRNSADVERPSVKIMAPIDGAIVAGRVIVATAATDNIRVERVEHLLDGEVRFTDDSAPWEWEWNTIESAEGAHTLKARAYDSSNNSAESKVVNVTVVYSEPRPNGTDDSLGGNAALLGAGTMSAAVLATVAILL
ncbi:MAG TPA: Ig-like domain-containing protein, partial [Thermoplasmata archaeon]|nr:Ig-like domain-containing protein [Thermoplasmata archaeon]